MEDQNLINNTDEITLADIFNSAKYYLFFWPYFLIVAIIGVCGSYIYLRYTSDIYETAAQVQIKKGDSDPTSFLTEGAENLLNFDKVNVENDIAIITSNKLLGQVVDRLDLQTSSYSLGRIKSRLIAPEDYLFDIIVSEDISTEQFDFIITHSGGKVFLTTDSLEYNIEKGALLKTDKFNFLPADSLFTKDNDFAVNRIARQKAIEDLKSKLEVSPASKDGEVVNLKYTGHNKSLNEQILNTLIQVLQEDQVADKRAISEVSIEFIDSRLIGLTQSIDTISQQTIAFQSSSSVFDPSLQTGNALSNIIKGQEQLLNLGIQREIASGLRENLMSQETFELLPANVGLDNESVNALVTGYNEVVIQKNNLLISATPQSPAVRRLDAQLQETRSAIINGISQYIESLDLSLERYNEVQKQTQSAVASLPAKENILRGFARNFQIVEQLYLFLLQRKEEASISYISALPNVKILSDAVTTTEPISPIPTLVYLVGVFGGLLLVFSVLLVLNLTDTKINTRDDLENGLRGNAIVGEIPLEKDETKTDSPRGTIAEAKRVMRSNLAFILPNEGPVVMTSTSSIKGEGKSFVSFNIAASYAALSKRVILIGADLRNPQLHNRLGIERAGTGLSTYLSKPESTDLKSLITLRENDNVHYLLSGAIPPNPSELLARPSMGALLEKLKESYDVIIVDSAPLMLVSDTSPILPLSDVILYVSRAQYTDKNVFPFIKDLQKRKNMPPLALVLNGIIAGPASYYKYGYAYRYSYNYKYNYGYGYGYGAEKSES
jgi:capsular exopolysaccharide synthesis family protein